MYRFGERRETQDFGVVLQVPRQSTGAGDKFGFVGGKEKWYVRNAKILEFASAPSGRVCERPGAAPPARPHPSTVGGWVPAQVAQVDRPVHGNCAVHSITSTLCH